MKRTIAIALVALAALNIAAAQEHRQRRDGATAGLMGPHVIFGHGCLACHPLHKSMGRTIPLWEQKPTAAHSMSGVSADDSKGLVTIQPQDTMSQPITVNVRCLSCHDGNLAKRP